MTKEEMIEMAKRAGFERLGHTAEDWVCHLEDIEEFTKLVAEKERDACAKVCEQHGFDHYCGNVTDKIAKTIRAMGNHDI